MWHNVLFFSLIASRKIWFTREPWKNGTNPPVSKQLSQEDINSLAAAFTSDATAFANGFSIGGEKFLCIRADARSLYGKKV